MTAPDGPAPLVPLDPILPEVVLTGELEVRTWRAEDAPALREVVLANLEHLRGFMPWIAAEPLSVAQRVEMIADWEAERQAGGGAVYGILRNDPGSQQPRIVGGTGIHRRIAQDGLEIGYWLAADEQGRGTISRVVAALTEVALAHPMITHVEIHMDVANTRSAAVPPRCGYTFIENYLREPDAPAATGVGMVWRRTR